MNRVETVKRLDTLLSKAETDQIYGSLELELRAGRVVIIRKTETERYEDPTKREQTHAPRTYR